MNGFFATVCHSIWSNQCNINVDIEELYRSYVTGKLGAEPAWSRDLTAARQSCNSGNSWVHVNPISCYLGLKTNEMWRALLRIIIRIFSRINSAVAMTNGSCLTLTREKLTALKIIIVLHFPNILDALFAPTLLLSAKLHCNIFLSRYLHEISNCQKPRLFRVVTLGFGFMFKCSYFQFKQLPSSQPEYTLWAICIPSKLILDAHNRLGES